MTYGVLFAAALMACVLTIAAVGSKPPTDHSSLAAWPQIHPQKEGRVISDKPLVAPAR